MGGGFSLYRAGRCRTELDDLFSPSSRLAGRTPRCGGAAERAALSSLSPAPAKPRESGWTEAREVAS